MAIGRTLLGLLQLVQTHINLRIRIRVDDITFMLTLLYDGKINK